MADLDPLFNKAALAAKDFNGSRRSYNRFFRAAIAFEQAGGERAQADNLVQEAIDSFYRFADETLLSRLRKGGMKIFEHEAVFVKPDSTPNGITRTGEGDYHGPIFEARLLEVIKLLQANDIYTDDIILDLGFIDAGQMRKKPYHILTIPMLNAQIAIADQYGEAFYVANPFIEFSDWTNFQKKQAGAKDTVFENVLKIVRKGNWQSAIIEALRKKPSKPENTAPLSDKMPSFTNDMIVMMVALHYADSREKEWPTARSGVVPVNYVEIATGAADWPEEKWASINNALYDGTRGLDAYGSLENFIKAHRGEILQMSALRGFFEELADEAFGLKPPVLIQELARAYPKIS